MTDMLTDIDEFRRQARTWIEANLVRRSEATETSDDDYAAARALQRKLFDAGWAGLSYPAEYGGRGLTPAHERAFREEASGYVTPDLGVAGSVTYGPIGP